ncbi:hypothetical protein [Streptomyces pinistramenti]|uniref:hypothetical protein n=1 Tax=Streptomyces pinistramenti TaxID=2884812 RepID=UPI001D08F7C1|nr:hypothetical protein [Streptomyces pinistramenti]MCB5906245.1 hypothetical protein [Streptomyces pinistramenti]
MALLLAAADLHLGDLGEGRFGETLLGAGVYSFHERVGVVAAGDGISDAWSTYRRRPSSRTNRVASPNPATWDAPFIGLRIRGGSGSAPVPHRLVPHPSFRRAAFAGYP